MKRLSAILLFMVTISLSSGCAVCPTVDTTYELISQLNDPMIPLGRAVEVAIDQLPPDAKDQVIFDAVVKRVGNADLFKPFAGYLLKSRKEGDTAVILLCTQDGREGIIEDVTCTTPPDMYRPTGSPCDYMLDVKKVCTFR